MNSVNIIGRTTTDIEMRKTPNGSSLIKFTVAINRNGHDGGADFVPVTAFGNVADIIWKYTRKGDFVGISGHLRIDSKDTREGKRTYISVIADHATLVGSYKAQNTSQPAQQLPQEPKPAWNEEVSIGDDELPF